jgi:hypothetical protein
MRNLNDIADINGEGITYQTVLDIIISDCSKSQVLEYVLKKFIERLSPEAKKEVRELLGELIGERKFDQTL